MSTSYITHVSVHVYMIGPRSVVFLSLDLVIYPEIPDTGLEIVTLAGGDLEF